MADTKQYFFTAQEVAELLKVNTKTIYRAAKLKAFPKPIKILRCERWYLQDIINWVQSQKGGDI